MENCENILTFIFFLIVIEQLAELEEGWSDPLIGHISTVLNPQSENIMKK